MIIRIIKCGKCSTEEREEVPNAGWPGWSCIHGVHLNGVDNPNFCPACTSALMAVVDREVSNGMD